LSIRSRKNRCQSPGFPIRQLSAHPQLPPGRDPLPPLRLESPVYRPPHPLNPTSQPLEQPFPRTPDLTPPNPPHNSYHPPPSSRLPKLPAGNDFLHHQAGPPIPGHPAQSPAPPHDSCLSESSLNSELARDCPPVPLPPSSIDQGNRPPVPHSCRAP
jgi:hypothetical protein